MLDMMKSVKHLSNIAIKKVIKTCFSARMYIKNTVDRLQTMVGQMFGKFDSPMSESLYPKLDDTPILGEIRHSQYRSLVG